jgi:putative transposase
MKKSRFTEQQVVRILAQGDQGEQTVTEICREHSISSATYYNWRRRFREMGVDEVREYRKERDGRESLYLENEAFQKRTELA